MGFIKKAGVQSPTLRSSDCRSASNRANWKMIVHKPVTGTTGRMSWSNAVLYVERRNGVKGPTLWRGSEHCPDLILLLLGSTEQDLSQLSCLRVGLNQVRQSFGITRSHDHGV